MPASTQATRRSTSIDKRRFILVVTTTIGSSNGTAPPANPVPAPRGTTARPWRRAASTQPCISSVLIGKQNRAGLTPFEDRGGPGP